MPDASIQWRMRGLPRDPRGDVIPRFVGNEP
jgi:hypothetical protein